MSISCHLLQGLFRNFDDTVLDGLKSHVERLVADTTHSTHETSQRCAAEIIAGLVRGSKHWSYSKVTHCIPRCTELENFTYSCKINVYSRKIQRILLQK